MFAQGQFINDANATPESIARKRAEIMALMPRFGQARYVGEGLGQLATGIGMGVARRKTDQAETAGRQSAQERFNAILGGGIQGTAQPGGFSVLGSMPSEPGQDVANDTMAALGREPAGGYRATLVNSESGGNWAAQNNEVGAGGKRGHFGRVQFGHARLEDAKRAGVLPPDMTPEQFMANPEYQKAAEDWHFSDLESQLAPYVGTVVNGQPLDMGALVAMGHLGGAGGAKKYVESGGQYNPADSFGTSLSDYAQRHGGAGGMNSPQMTAATVPMDALVSIISDPWATPEQRAMAQTMLDQQTQMNDPAYRMGLRADELAIQKAERELAQMDQPQPGMANLTDDEEAALGLNIGGVYQRKPDGSIVTVQEPPKGSARPLTAEERAMWGISPDDPTPYAIGEDGMPKALGGGGVTVNNDLGGGKFDDEFAKGDAASLVAVSDAGNMAMRNLGRIDQLDTILANTPTGAGAAFAQAAGEFGINTEGLDEIQSAQAIINSLVPEQRQPGSGPMSDADLALFKQSLPRIINQPGGNQTIIQTMRGIAQYDAEGAQIVQRLRAGEFGSGPTARAKAFELLQGRKNPLAEFKAPAGGNAPDPAAPPSDGLTPEERAYLGLE